MDKRFNEIADVYMNLKEFGEKYIDEANPEYFIFEGTQNEIIGQIAEAFAMSALGNVNTDRENAELILETLKKYQMILGDDEILKQYSENNSGGKKLILEEKHLYINVRRITFFLFLRFLDKKLQLPSNNIFHTSDILQLLPSKQSIVSLDEIKGGLCILMETARCGRKGTDKNLLIQNNKRQECINNHYQCDYNREGKCICTPGEVKTILNDLYKIGILDMKHGKYHYVSDFL